MWSETIELLKGATLVANIQEAFGVEIHYREKLDKHGEKDEKEDGSSEGACDSSDRENFYETERINGYGVNNRKFDTFKTVSSSVSKEQKSICTNSKNPEYTITNYFWYYLFLFGTELGDEIFYSAFIPFWFWNIDGAVGRRVVLVWATVMTIGQVLKDVVRWPRPACPPAVRLQTKWSQEYGMPSTHAMIGISIPFSVVLFTMNRYVYPLSIGWIIAFLWCTLVCTSRLYLGMHTVLDILVGLILAILLMIPLVPLVDMADRYFLSNGWVLAILVAITIATIVYYPCSERWTPTRGDTTMVVSVTAGVHVGAWLNYSTGLMSTPELPPPYDIVWLSYPALGRTILRTALGFCSIVATKAICKSLSYATLCAILNINSKDLMKSDDYAHNKNKVLVDLVYKDLTLEDGVILEIGDEYREEEEEGFSYSGDVQLSNEEALTLLNMDDFLDEEDTEVEEKTDTAISLYGIPFEKLKSKMTDVTGDGKVMKLVKENGVGELIPWNARVTLQYVGYFEYRDEPFDSTFTRGRSETFRLGQGALLPGLEIGITTMKKHETSIFILHPDLAFGPRGCPPRIPPNEEILFSVRTIDYLDNGSADTFDNLSKEERKQFANVVKCVQGMLNTANESFKKYNIKQAIREYQRAVYWLEKVELQNQEEEDEANKLLSRAYSNLAVCYNKEDMPRRACIACKKMPVQTAKSHFNHGRALLKMGEYAMAIQELRMSLKMEPNNKETFREIRLASEKQHKHLEIEKRLWGNCLKTEKAVEEATTFQKAAREMCENFVRDNQLLRQPLPEGLTPAEEKYIRQQAASFGISVTTHQRYGKEVTYLNKPNY